MLHTVRGVSFYQWPPSFHPLRGQVPIGEDDLPTPAFTSSAPRVDGGGGGRRARVFQGGFYRDLHRMLGVVSGTEVCLP